MDAGDRAFAAAATVGAVAPHLGAVWESGAAAGVNQQSLQLREVVAAATGVGLWWRHFVKVDIFRDTQQVLSLVFSGMASEALRLGGVFFGRLASLVSLDLSYVIPQIAASTTFIIIAVLACLLLCCFCGIRGKALAVLRDPIRSGHEDKSFLRRSQSSGRNLLFLQYALLLSTSLFLPIARSTFGVFACNAAMAHALDDIGLTGRSRICIAPQDCNCFRWRDYGWLLALAALLLVFFLIPFPLLLYKLISSNVPRGSRDDPYSFYDADGNLVPYTREEYLEDLDSLEQSKNPFSFLYRDFERHSAYHKIWVVVFNLMLVVIVVLTRERPVVQAGITLPLLFLAAAITSLAQPFISDEADLMDLLGRASVFSTALLGFLGGPLVAPAAALPLAVLINVGNAIVLLALLLLLCSSIASVRQWTCNTFGLLRLSSAVRKAEGRPLAILSKWNLLAEVRRRAWEDFFTSVFVAEVEDAKRSLEAALEELDTQLQHIESTSQRAVAKKAAAKMLPERMRHDHAVDRLRRLRSLQSHMRKVGLHRFRRHFESLEAAAHVRLMEALQQELEGVDVYCSFAPGAEKSTSKFGKMWVDPIPFTAVMVWDGAGHAFLEGDDLRRLYEENQTADVRRKKAVRLQLRAMDGEQIFFKYSEMRDFSVEDGQEQYQDSEGKTKYRTRYSTIRVRIYFEIGSFQVVKETKREMSAGFKVLACYRDGHGSGRAPHTWKKHYFNHERVTLREDDFGIDHATYRMTGKLARLLGSNKNKRTIARYVPVVREITRQYRQGLISERIEQEQLLSSAFVFHVFSMFALPRPLLTLFCQHFEYHPFLKAFPQLYEAELDFLYGRLQFILSSRRAAFWWLFWTDLFQTNVGIIQCVDDARDFLTPARPDGLPYRLMDRQQLEKELDQHAPGLRSEYLFLTPPILDQLYLHLDGPPEEDDDSDTDTPEEDLGTTTISPLHEKI